MENILENYTDYFYTASAVLCELRTSGSYQREREFIKIKDIKCDIQPRSAALSNGEHSKIIGESIRVFCAKDADIETGKYLETDGIFYEITGVERWNAGYVLTAERREKNES